MANTTVNLIREPVGAEGKTIHVAVGSSKIYEGIMVAQLDADATLVPGSTAASGDCIGVSTHEAAAQGRCAVETDRQYLFGNAPGADACSAATPIGWTVYMYDDHTIANNSSNGTRFKAGLFMGMQDGRVKVWVSPNAVRVAEALDVELDDSAGYFDVDNVEAALAQIVSDLAATTNGNGASKIGIEDAAGHTAAATVEAALAQLLAGRIQHRQLVVTEASLTEAAATQTLNIGDVLPANATILGVTMHTYTPFTGGTIADFTVDIGSSGDADALVDGADLFAAAVDGAPATMTAGVNPNKTFVAAGAQLTAKFDCASDNVAAATAGAVTIDVIFTVLA